MPLNSTSVRAVSLSSRGDDEEEEEEEEEEDDISVISSGPPVRANPPAQAAGASKGNAATQCAHHRIPQIQLNLESSHALAHVHIYDSAHLCTKSVLAYISTPGISTPGHMPLHPAAWRCVRRTLQRKGPRKGPLSLFCTHT